MDIGDMYEKVFEDLVIDYCDRNGIFLDKKERERLIHDLMYNSPGMWQIIDETVASKIEGMK